MKKKPGKYLSIHNDLLKYDNDVFLCLVIDRDDEFFSLMKPTEEELKIHTNEGYHFCSWGETQLAAYAYQSSGKYNDFRQTIVLFMAAMNNEL